MRIIKVDAIESTNTFLRNLYREERLDMPVCISAKEQTYGRGQMGTTWISEGGKNLTFSVFMPINGLALADQFQISMTVATALIRGLQFLQIPRLAIKWPNDILSDKYKICGILIENIVKNGSLEGVVIGIGLNVNQLNFEGLEQASSLKKLTGVHYDLDEILGILLQKIEEYFCQLATRSYPTLKKEYESYLFRKNKPSTFKNIEGDSFVGIIDSVTPEGKLRVLLEDEVFKDFDLKEIKLLY
ncbi:biotin--[acetyl-CoA-carboxylase] ligase [Aquimarina brevivitae]|uniref:BirA family biotin operon repressor/biotin-[acetyl-CoA-carboxylase] ligase n=1 Tax=Aquimarina brevivitae TaxID=323412 RepID=A0A4Q7PI62_9FLAO|nr:biotin--[acetyl-CoA-carboxylase] ligase [Aquimarina brevivitae]RZT00116.1 BirA family biotin operon repressor/biotin-[acetyl-CoA-carboxylase] ligase [Aquimarina brevivitae]